MFKIKRDSVLKQCILNVFVNIRNLHSSYLCEHDVAWLVRPCSMTLTVSGHINCRVL